MACVQIECKSANITSKAVKCAVKSTTFSKTFVKLIVKNSLLNILYRRLDLPEEEFVRKQFENCPYVIFKSKSRHPIIMLFHTWEAAFVDALNKGYLRELYLFMQDPETQEVVENYKFSLRYAKEHSYRSIDQTTLVETTEEFLSTLASLDFHPKLPPNTHLNIELSYNYDAPRDYNPHGFEAVLNPMALSIPELSLPVVLGKLNTGYHRLSCEARGKVFSISRPATPSVSVMQDQIQDNSVENRIPEDPEDIMYSAEQDASSSPESKKTNDDYNSASRKLTATYDEPENNLNLCNKIRSDDETNCSGRLDYCSPKPISSQTLAFDNNSNLAVDKRFSYISKVAQFPNENSSNFLDVPSNVQFTETPWLSKETPLGELNYEDGFKSSTRRKFSQEDDDVTPSLFSVAEDEDAVLLSSEDDDDDSEVDMKCVCRMVSRNNFATLACVKCKVDYHVICVGFMDNFPAENAFVCFKCDSCNCSDQKYVKLQNSNGNENGDLYYYIALLRSALYLFKKSGKFPVEFLHTLPSRPKQILCDQLAALQNSMNSNKEIATEVEKLVKRFFNPSRMDLSSEDNHFEGTPVKRARQQ